MNQVGQLKTFYVEGTPPVFPAPIYVWKFQWDGDVIVTGTENGSVVKRLNVGGNPAEGVGPPFVIPFRCEICDRLGNTVQVLTSTVAVNNPPTVVGAPTITPNNQAFPFQTNIKISAYDLENAGLTFLWYYGTNPIGGKDVTTGPVNVDGTYYGTLPGLTRDLYTNTLDVTIYGAGTALTCKIVDAESGTTRITVPTQGYDPGAPQFSVAAQPNTLTADASTLPSQYIAPGQTVHFTAFATDINPGRINFTWYLYGSNGWNALGIPFVDPGTRLALEGGGWRGDLVRAIDGESGSGLRTAIVSATNTATGKSIYSSIPVRLLQNEAPTMTGVQIYDVTTGLPITEITLTPPSRTVVRFSGTAADANSDVVYFQWDFTTPGAPANYTLYGRDAFVDVTDWPGSPSGILYSLLGNVKAVDRFDVSSSLMSIPQLIVKS